MLTAIIYGMLIVKVIEKNRNHLLIIQLLIKNIYLCLLYGRPSLVAQSVKNLPVVQEIWV